MQVSTEGDAFLLVFHDPADAVAYTIATQQVGNGDVALSISCTGLYAWAGSLTLHA